MALTLVSRIPSLGFALATNMGDTFLSEKGGESRGVRAKPGMRGQHEQVASPCPRQILPL